MRGIAQDVKQTHVMMLKENKALTTGFPFLEFLSFQMCNKTKKRV